MAQRRIVFPPQYGQPDVVVSHDLETSDLDWWEAYFLDAVAEGSRFTADQTVQIGWMITSLHLRADGALELWEPDFRSMPITWVRGLSRTARHLIVQREICEQINAPFEPPSIAQAASVSPNFGKATGLLMTRGPPSGRECGWVVRAAVDLVEDAKLCSTYEVALRNPACIPFWSLPTGSTVSWINEVIDVEWQGQKASSETNDSLARLTNSAFSA